MITAKDILCSRVVIGFEEERLSDLVERMKPAGAQRCVVLERPGGRALGVIRLTEVAAQPSSGNRILADLIPPVMPLTVREDERATAVAELLEQQEMCEAVVVSESGDYVGMISAASAFAWMQREQRAAREELERLVDERGRLNEILEKKVEQRSAELRGALEDFRLASLSLSHDVRAPLRAIQGYADLLVTGDCGALNPDGVFSAQSIKRAAARLELMAEEILDKAEHAFAARSPLPEIVDLNVILENAMEFNRSLLNERQTIVTKQGQLHSVTGRYVPLLQIVANLLENAVKYVPETRQPTIEVWSEDLLEHVNLCIKDNGAGVAPRHRQQIFEPFVRLATTTQPGVGLGLAIAKNAVVDLGGSISVESEEGVGSIFTVTLPKAAPAVSSEAEMGNTSR